MIQVVKMKNFGNFLENNYQTQKHIITIELWKFKNFFQLKIVYKYLKLQISFKNCQKVKKNLKKETQAVVFVIAFFQFFLKLQKIVAPFKMKIETRPRCQKLQTSLKNLFKMVLGWRHSCPGCNLVFCKKNLKGWRH